MTEGVTTPNLDLGLRQAYEDSLVNLERRLDGTIKPVSTGWQSLDKSWMSGIEPGWIVTLGGTSGTGKTAFANQMIMQMLSDNPKDIAVLFFTFEMSAKRLMHRMISNYHGYELKQLLGVADTGNITAADIKFLRENPPTNLDHMLIFEEKPKKVIEMEEKIKRFRSALVKSGKLAIGKPLVVVIDHLLLSDKTTYESFDEKLLENTMRMELRMVKDDPNLIFINLSQLNREMDSIDRVEKPARHFPIKSDLFGSDKVYQGSDVLCILDCPYNRGIKIEYGRDKIPVYDMDFNTGKPVPILYAHNLKVRDHIPSTLVPFHFIGKNFKFLEKDRVEAALPRIDVMDIDFGVRNYDNTSF